MPSFANTHSTVINTDAATIHALINDFHRWTHWSPWEKRDPELNRTYSGPDEGVGAEYAREGNKQVGTGRMEITASTPERIELDLEFIKPIKASNKTVFELSPVDGGTQLSWTMTGGRNVLMHVAGKLFFDKAIAKDFDQGLAAIKELAVG